MDPRGTTTSTPTWTRIFPWEPCTSQTHFETTGHLSSGVSSRGCAEGRKEGGDQGFGRVASNLASSRPPRSPTPLIDGTPQCSSGRNTPGPCRKSGDKSAETITNQIKPSIGDQNTRGRPSWGRIFKEYYGKVSSCTLRRQQVNSAFFAVRCGHNNTPYFLKLFDNPCSIARDMNTYLGCAAMPRARASKSSFFSHSMSAYRLNALSFLRTIDDPGVLRRGKHCMTAGDELDEHSA